MNCLLKSTEELILASSSPRRRAYLEDLGLVFRVLTADIDETVVPDELPETYVKRMALEKAESVAEKFHESWIVAADTVVCFGERVLGKPIDKDDAARMLLLLSGKEHVVLTGVCLLNKRQSICDVFSVSSRVIFWDFSEDVIGSYIESGEPMDKAGSYAIQGKGACLVREIHGSYSNVVGLPLCEFIKMLLRYELITE